MGSIGLPEMIFIFVLALLIFGPKKLPELGRSLGKGISEFRRASSELRSSLEREMETIEQDTRLDQSHAAAPAGEAKKDSAKDTHSHEHESYSYGSYNGEHHD